MEFIMLCYPVREVMLWQWIGNPDCLMSHQVVSCSSTMEAVITHQCLYWGGPAWMWWDENLTEGRICTAPET